MPSNESQDALRTALYARYSSDLQNHASIEDQLRMCKERAAKEGWLVAGAIPIRRSRGRS